MQQKALILGQQDNPKGMSDTFKQLLKEFPKSSVAAQAQFYIGKAAFDAKDYKNAIPALECRAAAEQGTIFRRRHAFGLSLLISI